MKRRVEGRDAVGHGVAEGVGQVRVERPAAQDVQELEAAADGQDGCVGGDRRAKQGHLEVVLVVELLLRRRGDGHSDDQTDDRNGRVVFDVGITF